jgi:hypothetical protein
LLYWIEIPMTFRALLLVTACAAVAAPASAFEPGPVRVAFANGRVTVVADNATIPEILREWARIGGSTFVNAERIPATERLTLRLDNEPETRALDVLLRPVIGYIAGPATAAGSLSSLGRVLIMPAPRPREYPVTVLRPVTPNRTSDDFNAARRLANPPRPDDDGPIRVEMPPVIRGDGEVEEREAAGLPQPNRNIQVNPALGIPTSSQPGVIINAEPARPGGVRVPPPPKPKPGGGGG